MRPKLLKFWKQQGHWDFIQPGKPRPNIFCERFNGTYRNEVLNCYEFATLAEARMSTKAWMNEYNHERPHTRLGELTPVEYEEK